MDRFLSWLGPALAAILFLTCISCYAASPVLRNEDFAGDCVLTVTNTPKPVLLSSAGVTSCRWSSAQVAQRNQVCIVNENTSSTNTVRISTFSTNDSAEYGWPIRGTEKECQDMAVNIPVWIWRNSSNPDQTVTIRVTR